MPEVKDQDVPPESYPENWDVAEQDAADSKKELKLKDGDEVRVRIISGPLTYKENYFKVGTKADGKTDKKQRIAMPFGSQLPGYELKTKHLIEVVVLSGPMQGQNKLFTFGKQIVDELVLVKKDWGSTRVPDLMLRRKGSGQLDTEYTAKALPPAEKDAKYPVKFNLAHEVRFSKKEDIEKLPPPALPGTQHDALDAKITPAQQELINSLGKAKDVDRQWFDKTVARKFAGRKLPGPGVEVKDHVTVADASELIDILKAL